MVVTDTSDNTTFHNHFVIDLSLLCKSSNLVFDNNSQNITLGSFLVFQNNMTKLIFCFCFQIETVSRPQSAHGYLRAHSRTGFTPSAPRSRPATAEPPVEKFTIPRAASAREVGDVRFHFESRCEEEFALLK